MVQHMHELSVEGSLFNTDDMLRDDTNPHCNPDDRQGQTPGCMSIIAHHAAGAALLNMLHGADREGHLQTVRILLPSGQALPPGAACSVWA